MSFPADIEEESKEPTEFVVPKRPKFGGGFGAGKKPGLNLATADDQDEDEVLAPPPKKPIPAKKGPRGLQLNIDGDDDTTTNNNIVGASGGTNDLDDEPVMQQPPPQKTKPAFKPSLGLTLDTEKINDLFTFGGEKGELKEEQALEKFEEDITELAQICVTAMRRKKLPKTEESEF